MATGMVVGTRATPQRSCHMSSVPADSADCAPLPKLSLRGGPPVAPSFSQFPCGASCLLRRTDTSSRLALFVPNQPGRGQPCPHCHAWFLDTRSGCAAAAALHAAPEVKSGFCFAPSLCDYCVSCHRHSSWLQM